MKKKNKIIGYIHNLTENIRPEFLNKKIRRHPLFIIGEIHRDKKYGAIIRISERNSPIEWMHKKMTKKEKQRYSKRLKKVFSDDKPVDTSKWVHPDRASIQHALVQELFKLVIFKEDYWGWKEAEGKSDAFYSVIHCHSPRNPQSLHDFYFEPFFEAIMREFKGSEAEKCYRFLFGQKGNKKYCGTNRHRKWYKDWKNKCLRGMVIVDKKPNKFKDLLGFPKRKKKESSVRKK